MIEAMACGTPVIALPGGAVAEVVSEGVSGWICGERRRDGGTRQKPRHPARTPAAATYSSASRSSAWSPTTSRSTRRASPAARQASNPFPHHARWIDVQEGIWVDDQYYILATTARATGSLGGPQVRRYLRRLRAAPATSSDRASTACITTARGTCPCSRSASAATRRCSSARGPAASNELFGADLTNPDVLEGGIVVLSSATSCTSSAAASSAEGHAYERIRLVNYSQRRVSLAIRIDVDADFVDIFEVTRHAALTARHRR